jgi:hypothetical protein
MSDLLRVTPAYDDDGDLLWGAEAIGRAINRDRRRTYYLLESGALGDAVRKVGAHWVGSRRKLLAALRGSES